MSNTPIDSGTSSPAKAARSTDESGASDAAAPARRRRHRPVSQRAAAPIEGVGQHVVVDEPPTPAASVLAEPAAPVHVTAPVEAEQPAAARARATGRPRGGRRSGRAHAPQLVSPERNEAATQETAAPTDASVAGAVAAAETHATVPMVPVLVGSATLAAPGTTTPPAGPAEHATQAEESPTHTATNESQPPAAHTPTRRYRFDRPAPRAAATALRPERLNPASLQPEVVAGEEAVATAQPVDVAVTAAPAEAPAVESVAPATAEEPTTAIPEALAQAPAAPAAPAQVDETPSPTFVEEAEGDELEAGSGGQADGAEGATTRRRRRRRRTNGANGTAVRHLEAVAPTETTEPEPVSLAGRLGGSRAGEPLPHYEEALVGPTNASSAPGERQGANPYGSSTQPYQMYAPYQQEPWDVSNPYEQLGQPQSPFSAPEPSPARGFGPQPRGVAGPAPERLGRSNRVERADGLSAAQLSATLTQAIQQQTDRLLTELRHTQAPPSMTVMFPPFPSTERVGVFVDVANLLYSSRSLRIGLDFGRLLEFLRGNRRLVRAHAYAPTNPEPHAEQQFLSVVKGVGYRITTKNYKTFSSGAKKADLDLDMCMDIVRLVDAKALETVVLVSGDSDFLPLLEYCSDRGVRVEVAAFDDSAAMILRQSCDLFINLSLVEEIRA